ncbi:MAG: FG-GAP repeat domain-containing protein, partial [Pirellulaceae bacterium]
ANDNVCFAAHDIDGDGRVDFAVGRDWQFNNSDSGGSIGWLHSPPDPRQPWSYHPLAEEPTTHRMRWMDWNRDGQLDLIVAPLKGRHSRAPAFAEAAVRLLAFTPDPKNPTRSWSMSVIDEQLHVMHNLD